MLFEKYIQFSSIFTCFFLKFISAIIVETKINIYCSNDFYFQNKLSKVCRWMLDNGTGFGATYESAFEDCPDGYSLGSFESLFKLDQNLTRFSCDSPKKMWIHSLNANYNVLTLKTSKTVELANDPMTSTLEYFLCVFENNDTACDNNEYLDPDSLSCLGTVGYKNSCYIDEMCDKSLKLACGSSDICDCSYTHYWDGSACSKKKFLNSFQVKVLNKDLLKAQS